MSNMKMTALVQSFPALRNAPGVAPWDEQAFLQWACGPRSHGEKCAAAFVLSVWDPRMDWQHGERTLRFDMHEALGCWDDEHRAAFAAWVSVPWWP